MIRGHHLVKRYKHILALSDVSIAVGKGEISGILGPNGAGKTTLFKILCQLIAPDSGSFQIYSSQKKPIGAIIEKPGFYDYLSAKDNLNVIAKIQGAKVDKIKIDFLLDTVGLPLDRKDPVRHFSLGMKQRLGIAMALVGDPDGLILDEPFLGLDPLGMNSLCSLIKDLALERKLAILLSSHLLEELSRVCDSLHVINNGKIIDSGSTKNVLDRVTSQFRVCGSGLHKSQKLAAKDYDFIGDCAVVELSITEAPNFLKALVDEGIEITYFGPEKNVNELYKEI